MVSSLSNLFAGDILQDMCKRLGEAGVSTVFDVLDLDDDKRRELLALSEQQLEDVAAVCSRYPDINLSYEVGGSLLWVVEWMRYTFN